MVGTRRRNIPEEPIRDAFAREESDSDDDAPEEVSLATGKEIAVQRKQEEQEARKKAALDAKERRKRRHSSAAKTVDDANEAEEDDEAEDDDEDEAEQVDDDMEFLPDHVVEAIAHGGIDRRPLERRLVSEQLRSGVQRSNVKKLKRDKEREEGRRVGPVVVKVLGKTQDRRVSEAAKSFLQQRLMSGVNRSTSMLQPTQIAGRFVYGPGSV